MLSTIISRRPPEKKGKKGDCFSCNPALCRIFAASICKTCAFKRKPMTSSPKYTVTFVGAGRLATQLAIALQKAGHRIMGIYSRTRLSADRLLRQLEHKSPIVVTNRLTDLPWTDVYIIAVTDTALTEVIAQWPQQAKDRVVLHTAGSLAMDMLKPISGHYGVLYPMQTFSMGIPVDFREVFVFTESNCPTAQKVVSDLALSISNHVCELSSAARKHLHIGAVMACNFSNHLYEMAFNYLSEYGIPPDCLLPLIDETVAKLHRMSPHEGQTGPACRGDRRVVEEHLQMLDGHTLLREFYKLFSDSIAKSFA